MFQRMLYPWGSPLLPPFRCSLLLHPTRVFFLCSGHRAQALPAPPLSSLSPRQEENHPLLRTRPRGAPAPLCLRPLASYPTCRQTLIPFPNRFALPSLPQGGSPAVAAAATSELGGDAALPLASLAEGGAGVDPAIAAWWAAQHATAFAAGSAPALPASFDVTVSPRESLQAAIDRCREGGSILLLPGAYEGGVVLTKEVHLFGRGEATLRRAVGEGPVITSTVPAATLDGLIVRVGSHTGDEDDEEEGHCGILIDAGGLLVRHCDVSSQSLSSIIIQGASANPTILGCKVHGSKEAGISFESGSKGRVEGCDIVRNGTCGLIVDGSEPVIVANSIHGSKDAGVYMYMFGNHRSGRMMPRLESNRIWENGDSGVEISDGIDASVVANDIYTNVNSGVSFTGGKVRLERNTIRENARSGVWVQGGGELTLIGNAIRDHAGSLGFGVLAFVSSIGGIEWGDGNRFSGNEQADFRGSLEPTWKAPPAAPPPPAPSDAHLNLLERLECVVCRDVMLRPFSVCPEGHASACMPCYKLLKACPVCRGKLPSPPTRLRLLEDWAQDAGLLVPCPHAADGCPLDALRFADAGAHAGTCDWRKVVLLGAFYAALPYCPYLAALNYRYLPACCSCMTPQPKLCRLKYSRGAFAPIVKIKAPLIFRSKCSN